MNNITYLRILIVCLTAVLALSNFGNEEFRKGKVKCSYSSSSVLFDPITKV
ncbi:hypothetical protein [Flavobacterium sp. JAS]|uniref:hypothetical protein n=1 Tax=Flavobacterium sp. JAS TaxID=2897329 RepID=UPI001E51DE77|nr:hypothetical protein [Flavobacterium sp. JAS]MCD0469714.1 hypothetical protein [Flavobacterium sp. JAS]